MSDAKPALTEPEAERLSLLRYQLLAANDAVAAPPPINTLAINIMQDAVESCLTATGEHISATIPNRTDFDKLFDIVVLALGNPPELTGLRAAAIALNNARVGFKHHGNQVRDATLRRHLDVAVTLIDALVAAAFGMRLDEVSMLLLVRDAQARGLIENAERLAKTDLSAALFRLRLAFDLIIAEYQSRKSVDGWQSIFDTKPNFFPSTFDLRNQFGNKGRDYMEKISQWVEALDGLTRLGAFGIDLQRFAYFDAVAPKANYYASDHASTPYGAVQGCDGFPLQGELSLRRRYGHSTGGERLHAPREPPQD